MASQLRSEAPPTERNIGFREARSCKHVSQHLARKEICFARKAKCAESRLRSFANGAKKLALALLEPGYAPFRFCVRPVVLASEEHRAQRTASIAGNNANDAVRLRLTASYGAC